ncbi:MAG: ABC transporter ATP-binding protein [Lachnospiraceae bacterium]|nr:ABC transporter ATP-binding protein [Lachnospiraceae bacterium]
MSERNTALHTSNVSEPAQRGVSEPVQRGEILVCEHLTCGYGKDPADHPVLSDLTFSLEEGKSLAILGANGCGKTTLLRAIGKALPYEGSIRMLGREIRDTGRKQIASMQAMLSQISSVYFSYTVEETVMLGRYLYLEGLFGKPSRKDRKIVEAALVQNGLYELKDRQISELSGGQLQRVFLARTMAQQTPVLILDEPTNHLDLKYQEELISFLQEWKKGVTILPDGREIRHTLIGVFHDVNLAMDIADELLLMKQGRILSKGEKAQAATNGMLQEAFGMDVASYMKKHLSFWG